MDLNQIVDILEKLLMIVGPHWPLITVAFILAVVGEVIKSFVFKNPKKIDNEVGWRKVFATTMIAHPILAGALFGLILNSVAPAAIASTGLIGTCLYFALSGFLSTWLYRAYKELGPVLISGLKSLIRVVFKKIGASPSMVPDLKQEENTDLEEEKSE